MASARPPSSHTWRSPNRAQAALPPTRCSANSLGMRTPLEVLPTEPGGSAPACRPGLFRGSSSPAGEARVGGLASAQHSPHSWLSR